MDCMSRIVGIDLGTTNSLVATVESGIPLVIADADGQRLTPSVVHVPAQGGELIVGRRASHVRIIKPAETVYSVKRFMGRRASELSDKEHQINYRLCGTGTQPITIDLPGRQWAPEEISAEILRKLKGDAEAFFGEPVTRAVITVPAYFNDAQRNATKRAGELAGLTVERIINEPTAAALAYGLNRLKEKSKIAVYDLGGGTFDLSILELHEGVFHVLATSGNTQLGGDDLDTRVTEFLAQKIKDASGPDILRDPVLLARVREAAEHAKIQLSTETEVEVTLPFLTPKSSFSHRLARGELEELTREIIMRTRPHCLRSLSDARLEPTALDQVILVGGQTRMPLVRRLVAEWFACADFEEARGDVRLGSEYHRPKGPQLNTSQNPDEAVALGAAIQAILSMLREESATGQRVLAEVTRQQFSSREGGLIQVTNITSHTLGVVLWDEKELQEYVFPMIRKMTAIPALAKNSFGTASANMQHAVVKIVEGESSLPAECTPLGICDVKLPPFLPKGSPVELSYEYNANQVLEVAVEACGNRSKVSIGRNTGLAPEEIEAARSGLSDLTVA